MLMGLGVGELYSRRGSQGSQSSVEACNELYRVREAALSYGRLRKRCPLLQPPGERSCSSRASWAS